MSTVAGTEATIDHARVTRTEIIAYLADGRVIRVPLAWSWRLSDATPAQRANFRLVGAGHGIHWPDVDEDISVDGMLHGSPAPRPRNPAREVSRNETRKKSVAARSANQPLQRTGSARR